MAIEHRLSDRGNGVGVFALRLLAANNECQICHFSCATGRSSDLIYALDELICLMIIRLNK